MMIAIMPTRRPYIAAGDHSGSWPELKNSCGVAELEEPETAVVTWEVRIGERE